MSVSSLINTEIFTWLSFFLTYLIENVLSLDGRLGLFNDESSSILFLDTDNFYSLIQIPKMHLFLSSFYVLISSYHFLLLQVVEQSSVSNAILGRILGATTLSTTLCTNITCHQLENVKAVVSKWCSSSELVSSTKQ